jgi:D-threo-aldose 1-dehydrogenase
MRAACDAFGVPLAAAALQFSARDARIHSTVVGMSAPERILETLDLLAVDIPDELWDRLEALTPPPELWIG